MRCRGWPLASRHLCPALLAMMLDELEVRPDVQRDTSEARQGQAHHGRDRCHNASMPVENRLRQGWCSSLRLRLRRGRSGVATKRHFDPFVPIRARIARLGTGLRKGPAIAWEVANR